MCKKGVFSYYCVSCAVQKKRGRIMPCCLSRPFVILSVSNVSALQPRKSAPGYVTFKCLTINDRTAMGAMFCFILWLWMIRCIHKRIHAYSERTHAFFRPNCFSTQFYSMLFIKCHKAALELSGKQNLH